MVIEVCDNISIIKQRNKTMPNTELYNRQLLAKIRQIVDTADRSAFVGDSVAAIEEIQELLEINGMTEEASYNV